MARVYAIASAKGGVGKTTTTANLGTVLAMAGHDVVVVDGDLGMPNLAGALGVDPDGRTLHDVLTGDAAVEEALYEGPAGLSVLPGSDALEAFATADATGLESVVDALDEFDYVLVDTGAGLSNDTFVPLKLADEILLVSTTERGALGDTEKTRQLAARIGAETVGVVLTRVDQTNPNAEVVASSLDAGVVAVVPEDTAIREALDTQTPVVARSPDSLAAAGYRALGEALTGRPVPVPESPGDAANPDRPSASTDDSTPESKEATDDPTPESAAVNPPADSVSDLDPDASDSVPPDAVSVVRTDAAEEADDTSDTVAAEEADDTPDAAAEEDAVEDAAAEADPVADATDDEADADQIDEEAIPFSAAGADPLAADVSAADRTDPVETVGGADESDQLTDPLATGPPETGRDAGAPFDETPSPETPGDGGAVDRPDAPPEAAGGDAGETGAADDPVADDETDDAAGGDEVAPSEPLVAEAEDSDPLVGEAEAEDSDPPAESDDDEEGVFTTSLVEEVESLEEDDEEDGKKGFFRRFLG